MALLSPVFQEAQFDNSGNLLNGGKIYTYAAGSSTPLTTYQDQAGTIPHANPIVLNSRGEPPNPIWLVAGSEYKLWLKDSTDVSVRPPIDDVFGINDVSGVLDEWKASGLTPTFISATSFSVPGDQTSVFHVGRRLKMADSGGTDYGRIVTSVFTSLTTVTVALDAGTLDSGLSAVSLSLLAASNQSIPAIGLVFINTVSVTNAANLSLSSQAIASFRELLIHVMAFPVTDGALMHFRLGTAGTFLSGASDYAWASMSQVTTPATLVVEGDDADTLIKLSGATKNNAQNQLAGEIRITTSSSIATRVSTSLGVLDQVSSKWGQIRGFGASVVGPHDSFQIFASSGNITGSMSLYGIR